MERHRLRRRVPPREPTLTGVGATPGGLDLSLLDGFAFECRPNCGLCCFATPKVDAAERTRLVQLDPNVVFDSDGSWSGIALHGEGGACGLLTERRCRLHEARPAPCRLFPLHVHLGASAQATLVLSCPGLRWPGVGPAGSTARPRLPPPVGLDPELGYLAERIRSPEAVQRFEKTRAEAARRRQRASGFEDPGSEEEGRRGLQADPPLPGAEDFPAPDGPAESDRLESLPLFQDPVHGTVAMAWDEGSIELLQLDPLGGISERLGRYLRPERPPRLDEAASARLSWYLALLVRREAYVDSVRMERGRTVGAEGLEEALVDGLRWDGASVLERAGIRAMLQGRTGTELGEPDVCAGIRAIDAELLDRPALGGSL